MTATEELRRLLDERGVEWRKPAQEYWVLLGMPEGDSATIVGELSIEEATDGTLVAYNLTPAQAIAATLGAKEAYTREDVEGAFVSGYSLGLDMFDSSKPDGEKGWNQNERNLDEEMEDLGWVRKEAATLGAGTCKADETDLIPFVRADSGDCDVDYIHVMECSVCGGTYEHVNGSYEFCPHCGARIVEVDE